MTHMVRLALFFIVLPLCTAVAEPVVLKMWCPYSEEPNRSAMGRQVERFNAGRTDVQVELLYLSWSSVNQKTMTSVAGGAPPDLAVIDRFLVASYAYRGVFEELGAWAAEEGITPEMFYPATWEECVFGGKLYALPHDTDTRMLFYNKKLFREAGLDPERPPRTWREVEEYSRRLTVRDSAGRLAQVGLVPQWGNTTLYQYAFQKGARYLSEDGWTARMDSPEIVSALRWMVAMNDLYGGWDALSRFASGFGQYELDPFLQGKIAMTGDVCILAARADRYNPELEYGIAHWPYPEDGEQSTWSGGFSFVIPKGSKHPEEAKQVIRFMIEPEQQIDYCAGVQTIPAVVEASRAAVFMDDWRWRTCIEAMAYSRSRPVSPAGGVLNDESTVALDYAVSHKGEPQALLALANGRVQRYLDNLRRHESHPLAPMGIIIKGIGGAMGLGLLWRVWVSTRRVRRMKLYRQEAMDGYLMAAPALIGLLGLMAGPLLGSVVLSLTSYDILRPARWLGLENYRYMFTEDPLFWKSLWNTAAYALMATPLGIVVALALASLLNARLRGQSILRTLFFLPSVVPVVAGSLLWLWLFNGQFGLLNVAANALHLPGAPYPWLDNEHWAKPSIVIMSLWGVGGGMVICLAALQGVPQQLYEAAMLDGAGAARRFWHITLPQISPALFFLTIMGVIGSLQVFTQAFVMTLGGPVNSTLFFVYYLYRRGFEYFEMGYASALAWVLFVLVVCATAIQFYYGKRWVHYGE